MERSFLPEKIRKKNIILIRAIFSAIVVVAAIYNFNEIMETRQYITVKIAQLNMKSV